MRKVTLTIEVTFDETLTDAESVAVALDRLMETALSTPGITEEYGCFEVNEFLVADGHRWVGEESED